MLLEVAKVCFSSSSSLFSLSSSCKFSKSSSSSFLLGLIDEAMPAEDKVRGSSSILG